MGKSSRRKRQRQKEASEHESQENVNQSVEQLQAHAADPLSLSEHKEHKKKKKNTSPDKHDDSTPEVKDESIHNPLVSKLNDFLESVSPTERDHFFSETKVDAERRSEIWAQQAEVGEELVNNFSWAVPNERAMTVLKHFAPLVEIGCGANAYWCQQMKQAGIDIVGYDSNPASGGKIGETSKKHKKKQTFSAKKGGPEVLTHSSNEERNLFLCYPDDNESSQDQEEDYSLGLECVEQFQGDYVIHVGEIYGDTLSVDQAPWGRSSSPFFQQHLATLFHCVIQIPLPNWIHVRDTLTVWKRSTLCQLVFAGEDEDESTEEVTYRHVPPDERLPAERVAPCLAHLFYNNKSESRTNGLKDNKISTPTRFGGAQKGGDSQEASNKSEKSAKPSNGKVKGEEPASTEPKHNKHASSTEPPQEHLSKSEKKLQKKRKLSESEDCPTKGDAHTSTPKSARKKNPVDKTKEKQGYECQW